MSRRILGERLGGAVNLQKGPPCHALHSLYAACHNIVFPRSEKAGFFFIFFTTCNGDETARILIYST